MKDQRGIIWAPVLIMIGVVVVTGTAVFILIRAGDASQTKNKNVNFTVVNQTDNDSDTQSSAISTYDECVKAKGEIGGAGINVFCSIQGKTYTAPAPNLQPGEKVCGDVICTNVNGVWVPK